MHEGALERLSAERCTWGPWVLCEARALRGALLPLPSPPLLAAVAAVLLLQGEAGGWWVVSVWKGGREAVVMLRAERLGTMGGAPPLSDTVWESLGPPALPRPLSVGVSIAVVLLG